MAKKQMSQRQVPEVHVILGGGGVGKTSLVAALTLQAALQGKKVLAITYDPSLRLKDLLTPSVLQDVPAIEIFLNDPIQIFQQLLQDVQYDQVETLKSNKLFKHLLEDIVGLQEFTSLYYLQSVLKSQKYDTIFVDTPPFQNALDFLEAPEHFKNLFESKFFKMFLNTESSGLLGNLLKTSSLLAMKTLKSLTGSDFFQQLIDFVEALEKLQQPLYQTLEQTQRMFERQEVKLDYISTYDLEHLRQTQGFFQALQDRHLHIDSYYLNRYVGDLSGLIQSLAAKNAAEFKSWQYFLAAKQKNFNLLDQELNKLKKDHKIKVIKIPFLKLQSENLLRIVRDWQNLVIKD